jgi:dihydrofolate reductase
MGKLKFDIAVSLDGYVAGPDIGLEDPLGRNGERLHDWKVRTRSFQEEHGRSGEGGETGVDDEVSAEHLRNLGATIMGRGMYSAGSGPWEDDPKASGWWGDDPPFHHPVYVLTSHARDPLPMEGGTTFHFVTDGIESALEQARAAAGDKDVMIGGGGQAIQGYLKAGLVDEFMLHVVPMFLGDGVRLFDNHEAEPPRQLTLTRSLQGPSGVVHLSYEVADR